MGEVEKPGVKEIVASLTPAYMVSSNLQNKHTNVHIDTPGVLLKLFKFSCGFRTGSLLKLG